MELENSYKDNILRTDSIKEKADQNGTYPKTHIFFFSQM